MPNIKKYFVIASLTFGAHAVAAAAAENHAALPQAATLAQAEAVTAKRDAGKATAKAATPSGKAALTSQPAHWSMLLVGAGVLLLPRKRRVDNSVR
jgi:hypothetical protein